MRQTITSDLSLLIALVTLMMAGGCSSHRSVGDAMLCTSEPFTGHTGDRAHSVEFPSIYLDRVRSYHFAVRDLPQTVYQYTFIMPLPYLDAMVEFVVARPDGTIVASDTCRLGDFIRPYTWAEDGQWKMSLEHLRQWGPMTDYDLTINVIKPTPGWPNRAELRGFGRTQSSGYPHPVTTRPTTATALAASP